MIREAMERILKLAAPNTIERGGLSYVDKTMSLLSPPICGPVKCSTLKGLVDLFDSEIDKMKSEGDVIFRTTRS